MPNLVIKLFTKMLTLNLKFVFISLCFKKLLNFLYHHYYLAFIRKIILIEFFNLLKDDIQGDELYNF